MNAMNKNHFLYFRFFRVYFELGKVRLSAMILVTTITGFLMACRLSVNFYLLFMTILGTAGATLGANAFNEWLECSRDARMKRTCNRPLPARRITSRRAFIWSTFLSFAGVSLLAFGVNFLTAFLAFLNIVIYVLFYTPLKPRSSLCTLIGGICGAIPPMIGWAAVTGSLDFGAWALGAILFIKRTIGEVDFVCCRSSIVRTN